MHWYSNSYNFAKNTGIYPTKCYVKNILVKKNTRNENYANNTDKKQFASSYLMTEAIEETLSTTWILM